MDPELVVRDRHLLPVDALVDPDRGDLVVAVVRNGVDRLLDREIIAETVLVDDDVVMDQVCGDFGNPGTEGVADDLRYLARAARDSMGIVFLAVRRADILAGRQVHEIRAGRLVTQAFDPVEGRRGDVQQRNTELGSHLAHRLRIIGMAVPVQAVLLEPAAGDRRQQDRFRAGGQGRPDEEPEIVLVSTECGRIAGRIILLSVVVAEFDEDIVARLEGGLDLVPEAQVDETLGAAAVLGIVDDLHAVIDEIPEHHAPAAFRISAGQVLVRHGGIAHQVDGEGTAEADDGCHRKGKENTFHQCSIVCPLTVTWSKVTPSAYWISTPLSAEKTELAKVRFRAGSSGRPLI